MTATKEVLAAIDTVIQGLPGFAALPARPPSRLLVEALQATNAAPAPQQGAVLEALRGRLVFTAKAGMLQELSRRDLQNAPWILWNGTPAGAAIPGLLDAVFTQAVSSSRTTRNLIEAWLRDFAPEAPAITAAGQAIQKLLVAHPDRRLDRWRAAQHRFDLFDARRGPRTLAHALLQGDDAVESLVAASGFDEPIRASGGYMRATLLALLHDIPAALRGPKASTTLQRCLDAVAPADALRFGTELHGEIGRALLGAWLDGGREPDPALRDPVRNFLLRHLGDPRLRAPNWMAVGEPAIVLMRSWVARASLKAFFQLIADNGLDEQWRYREAFWSACMAKSGIDDMWLVLGSQVPETEPAIADLDGAYGRLDGASGNQSVLLLRVGALVFCEWSHAGKLRAWPVEWKTAPRLHELHYRADTLAARGLPFPPNAKYGTRGASDGMGLSHFYAERNYWQGSAAELLAQRAGIQLTEADWSPQ